MARFTLRTRLTIAYTAVVAVALLCFSWIAFAAVHATLGAQLESRLIETSTAVQPVPDIRGGRVVLDPDDRQVMLTLLAQSHLNGFVLDAAGRTVFSSSPRPPAALVAAIRAGATGRDDVRVGGESIAYRTLPVRQDGRTYGSVTTWSSRSFNDDVARTTLLALLGAALAVIAVAALVGGWFARRLLRPVTDVSAVISHIEATDLSERLAWTGADDELGRLCSTFDRLLDRLEEAFDHQRRFTADASHELRTPLSVMRAEIELALARDRDAEAYRRALTRLQAECTRLEALVESLLLSARGDSSTLATALISLDDVARRVIDRMQTPAAAAGVTLEHRGDERAITRGDQPLIESATLAIVDNAIRYSSPENRVRLTVDVTGRWARMIIADTGPGFTDRALKDARQRFWRDDPARSGSSTGLGLSIAHEIAQRHGGTLELRNDTRAGAVVCLSLPLENARLHRGEKPATIMNV